MKIIYYLILIIFLLGCRNSKQKHLRTIDICQNNNQSDCGKFHLETFNDLGIGLPGSDLNYDYLTDSSTFRLFIGKYDDVSEILTTDIKGDSIIVIKSTSEGQSSEWQDPKILEKKVYSLSKLRKQRKFE